MLYKIINYQNTPFYRQTRSNKPVLPLIIDNYDNYEKIYKKENIWISATEFDNFCNKDKFSDWLNALKSHYNLKDEDEEENKENFFIKYLFKKGVEYEEKVINELRTKLQLPLPKHSSMPTSRDYKDDKLAMKDKEGVLKSMIDGEPVIYSGLIFDDVNRLRGIPDLLVRNDFISFIFPNQKNLENKRSLFGNYYYLPIEIKYSTLHLNKTSIYFLNQDRMKIYKTQLYTYCKILESMQGILPQQCFIIGKKTVLKDEKYNPFFNTGIVDFSSFDKDISSIFKEGYDWLSEVKTKFLNWNVFTKPEIYPNLKVDHPFYGKIKKNIGSSLNDITEIWQCSDIHRKNAHLHGIYKWSDTRLTSSILGLHEKHSPIVDQILKTNRGELGDYFPPFFSKDTNNFKQITDEMFVDFETIHNIDIDINENINENEEQEEFIFLIGVWYKNNYYRFIIDEMTKEQETKILNDFYLFWEENQKPKIWHWYAETELWKRATKRNSIELDVSFNDLYEVYQKEPFTVKGCKNFKLKSYIKALYNLGKIHAEFPPSCDNGLDAMIIAYQYYREKEKDGDKDDKKFNDMITYNQLDCKYLEILLNFARSLL